MLSKKKNLLKELAAETRLLVDYFTDPLQTDLTAHKYQHVLLKNFLIGFTDY